jgi:homoserine O-acetyltransferase/O-succinyltransferase
MPANIPGRLGRVKTRFFTFGQDAPFVFKSQETVGSLTLAYETYGELNAAGDNAVLLLHALTGSQHAAGYNPQVPEAGDLWTEECQTGWWDHFIGPGKALDTNQFCIICANYIGGCYGSSGPSSIDPKTGKNFGASFPRLTFADIVDTQVHLLDHLGINRLHAVVGASIGGLMCLSLSTRYPDRVRHVIPIASGLGVTPLQRIINFEQIFAIENDPEFAGGSYAAPGPQRGMGLARMISQKTFVSLQAIEDRARIEINQPTGALSWYQLNHPLESYMLHQGDKFVRRFDANSYLRILDAWQRFNLVQEAGVDHLDELLIGCRGQNYLIFGIDSDVCFYPEEQRDMARALDEAGVSNTRITVHSDKGHDAFLIQPELFKPYLQHVLNEF